MGEHRRVSSDRIEQRTATWLGHATVLLELDGVRLLTDPVLRDRVAFLRRVGAPDAVPDAVGRIDAVLLSHLHHDHCDLWSLRKLGAQTRLVVPPGAGEWLRGQGFRNVSELAAGRSVQVATATVTAVPAEHDGFRVPFGPRAAAQGYIVSAAGVRCYFAGDTDLFAGMRDLGATGGGLDLALLPVWGWGTSLGQGHLDPSRAADAVTLLEPRLSVPIHWGTLLPLSYRSLRPGALRTLHLPATTFARQVRARDNDRRVVVADPGQRVMMGA